MLTSVQPRHALLDAAAVLNRCSGGCHIGYPDFRSLTPDYSCCYIAGPDCCSSLD